MYFLQWTGGEWKWTEHEDGWKGRGGTCGIGDKIDFFFK